jgi:dUTP diphosphatase
MKKVKIKVLEKDGLNLPKYGTELSAGADIYSYNQEPIELKAGETKLIPTGLQLDIPDGYEIQLRPRSGLALKHQLTMLNTPATIDADYKGEIGVILTNLGKEKFIVEPGMRIAQMVLNKVEQIKWEITDNIGESDRGAGGFGSTGTK